MQHIRVPHLLSVALLVGLTCMGIPLTAQAVDISEDLKFFADDGATGDLFGYTVATDGARIAVGGRDILTGSVKTGGAYIFDAAGNQIKKLSCGETLADGDRFGGKVLIDGDLAFVTAQYLDITVGIETFIDAGAIFVFDRNEGGADNWGQVAKIVATHPYTGTPRANTGIGSSMSYDATTGTLAVGIQNESLRADGSFVDRAGAAYFFGKDVGGTGNWGQIARVEASDPSTKAYFGQVSLDGDTVAIGSYFADRAYIFEDDGAGNWTETAIIEGEADSRFGTGTSLEGDTLLIGAYYATVDELSQAGKAYVYDRNEGGADNWGLVTELISDTPTEGEQFATRAALDGDKIIIGSQYTDVGDDGAKEGSAYAFGRNTAGQWVNLGRLVASDGLDGDRLGYSTSLAGDMAVVSALKGDGVDDWIGNPTPDTGSVYVFTLPEIPAPSVPGDTDGDGYVDETDAATMAGNWGLTEQTGGAAIGDFNADGNVDMLDASILAANWNPAPSEAAAVPEPSTVGLLLGLALCSCAMRRRNR